MLLHDHGNFQLQNGVLGSFILPITVINYRSHPSSICLPKCPGRLRGQPASYSEGTGVSFLGLKRPKRKADHSLLSVPWLRMSGAAPPFLLYVITALIGTTVYFIIKSNYSSVLCIIIRGSSRKEIRRKIRKQLRVLI